MGACRIVTSERVLSELLNHFADKGNPLRTAATTLTDRLFTDPNVEVIPLTTAAFKRGLKMYKERPDKEWGITNCSSFLIMDAYEITEALTYDHHFVQAGYKALLRPEE